MRALRGGGAVRGKREDEARSVVAGSSAGSVSTSSTGRVGGVQWPTETVLTDFASAHSGSWDGTFATFDPSGTALELPHQLQPGAALEWGVPEVEQPHREVWTLASELSSGYDRGLVTASTTAFHPEIGCSFGEEVAASNFSRTLFSQGAASFSFLASGAYNHGPLELPQQPGVEFEVESCIVPMHIKEDYEDKNTITQRSRLRIVHMLRTNPDGNGTIEVRGIKLAREVRTNSDLKRMHFASSKRTDLTSLGSGQWQASEGGSLALTPGPVLEMVPYWGMSPRPEWSGVTSAAQVLQDEGPEDSGVSLTMLPCGVWSIVAQRYGMLLVETGELAGPRLRRVSARLYTEGSLEQVILGEDWRCDGWSRGAGDAPRSPEEGSREERKMVESALVGDYDEDGTYRLREQTDSEKAANAEAH